MTSDNTIYFYSSSGKYGCFSNFSNHPIRLEGKIWPTTEHYFQAKKFEGTIFEEQIRKANTPGTAAKIGRKRSLPLRQDWELVKENIMLNALLAKFRQHSDIKQILLDTGDAKLVEHTVNDKYWADGGDGSGQNRLGHLLETVRSTLN